MMSNIYTLFFAFLAGIFTLVEANIAKNEGISTDTRLAKRLATSDGNASPPGSTIFATTRVTDFTSTTTTFSRFPTEASGNSISYTLDGSPSPSGSTVYVTISVTEYTSTTTVSSPYLGEASGKSGTATSNENISPSESIIYVTKSVTDYTSTTTVFQPHLTDVGSKLNASTPSSSFIGGHSNNANSTTRTTIYSTTTMTYSHYISAATPASTPVSPNFTDGSEQSNNSLPINSSVPHDVLKDISSLSPTMSSSTRTTLYTTITITTSRLVPSTTPVSTSMLSLIIGSTALSNTSTPLSSTPTKSSVLTGVSSGSSTFNRMLPPGVENLTSLTASSHLVSTTTSDHFAPLITSMPISKSSEFPKSTDQPTLSTSLSLEVDVEYSTITVTSAGTVFLYYTLVTETYTRSLPSTIYASISAPSGHFSGTESLTTATLDIGQSTETITLTLGQPILVDTSSTMDQSDQSASVTVTVSLGQSITVDQTFTETRSSIITITAIPSAASDSSSLPTLTTSRLTTSSASPNDVSRTSSSMAVSTSLSDSMGALLAFGIAALLV